MFIIHLSSTKIESKYALNHKNFKKLRRNKLKSGNKNIKKLSLRTNEKSLMYYYC
jgi:hypothetical protein